MYSHSTQNYAVEVSQDEIRSSLLRKGKIRGITFHPKALRALLKGLINLRIFEGADTTSFERNLDIVFALLKESIEKSQGDDAKYAIQSVIQEEHTAAVLESLRKASGAEDTQTQLVASSEHGGTLSIQTIGSSITSKVDSIMVSEVPSARYDMREKKWKRTSIETAAEFHRDEETGVHPAVQLMEARFDLVFQRLLRHTLFESIYLSDKLYSDSDLSGEKFMLVSQLPRISKSASHTAFLYGLFSKTIGGQYFLEDPFARLPVVFENIDGSSKLSSMGFVLNNSPVVVRGSWDGTSIRCYAIGLPPGESRALSQQWLGHKVDLFGKRKPVASLENFLPNMTQSGESQITQTPGKESAMCLFFADFHLDDYVVLHSFRRLLKTLLAQAGCVLANDKRREFVHSSADKLVIVLCGNFLKNCDNDPRMPDRYAAALDNFSAFLKKEFPEVASQSLLYFVPGPQDLTSRGRPAIFPMAALPSALRKKFTQNVPHATFATNPLRLRVFEKELTVFRDDSADRMKAESVLPSKPLSDNFFHGEAVDLFAQVTQTIFDNSHLYPFRRNKYPVFPSEDPALRLFPLPEALFLCDTSSGVQPGTTSYLDCMSINPGSFARARTFAVYHPVSGMYSLTNATDV